LRLKKPLFSVRDESRFLMQLDKKHKWCYNQYMRKTFKYRLFPTPAQSTALQASLNACRWVYNKTLELRRNAWQEHQESLSLFDTIKLLPEWKRQHPFLNQAYSQSLTDACTRVDLAFQHFFRRCKKGEKPGYPRFKGDWYKSFTYPQSGFGLMDDGTLRLAKIGNVRIKMHRPIRGKIKTLIIKRDRLGNWYACFSCEVQPEPLPPTYRTVGIDLGLSKLATLSTGEEIENPRFYRKGEKDLAKAQRKLSVCKKGTPEYLKRKRAVQHIHQRIVNRRNNFAHQLSRRLVNENQIIVFEDLDIQKMQNRNFRSLNKGITDAAWHQLVQYTTYKAENANRLVVLVDPRNTSQTCSGCGAIVPKDLSVRVHNCPRCGLVLDRDHNAALNILARGMASLGASP